MNEALLKKRLDEAPRMEPMDAVKLVYQNAFGCGHLIDDENGAAERVRAELKATRPDFAASGYTLIGGGLCRLDLAAPQVRRLRPERIARMMRLTAAMPMGGKAALDEGLRRLRRLAEEGQTPFSLAALDGYLAEYRKAGCPMVSHSSAYRAAYLPAYRVVHSDFITLLPLIEAIDARLDAEERAVCVLDGYCGAGKTTLAGLLCGLYDAPVVHMDDFFLPPELRTPKRLSEQGGNIHYERFEREVLPYIGGTEGFCYHRYDCVTGAMLERQCPPAPLRVAEGSYGLHPRFLSAYGDAITAFVEVDGDTQLRRIARRSPDKLEQFRNVWIPLEKSYFQAYDIKGRAKLVLSSLPWEE